MPHPVEQLRTRYPSCGSRECSASEGLEAWDLGLGRASVGSRTSSLKPRASSPYECPFITAILRPIDSTISSDCS